jgi:hypothetical protein
MPNGDARELTQPTYYYQGWPAWRYGPNGEAEVFESGDQVPEGWTDAPVEHDDREPELPLPEPAKPPPADKGKSKATVEPTEF